MNWDEIMEYDRVIVAIATKYSGERTLAEDVAQETRLRLFTDTRLDTNKFDPKKKDAAIRNTIRNKIIKVLKSRKIGRWQYYSLDTLIDTGHQIDTKGRISHPNTDTIMQQTNLFNEEE